MKHKRISDIIDIKKLEHESRKYLCLGFVVAILVHIIAGIYLYYRLPPARYRIAEKKYREPIPVDIIILPPRIRNPYETWIKIILQKVYGRKEFVHRFPGGEIPVKQPLPFEEPQDDYYKYIDTDALIQAVLDADIPDSVKALIDPEQLVIERIYEDLTTTRESEILTLNFEF